jgi:DNA-binding NarL/FixJ family response regulator
MVDDHDFLLSTTKPLLKSEGIDVIGTANSYLEAELHAFDLNPDVIIVDLNLAGHSGIELIQSLRDKRPEARTLIFSARTTLPTIEAAYRIGAKGYLTKVHDPSELVAAIRTIAKGKPYFMPGYALKIMSYQTDDTVADPRKVLTPREYKLFVLLAQGASAEEAADILAIVPKSIATRTSEIRKKLKLAPNDSFATLANRYGIAFIRE